MQTPKRQTWFITGAGRGMGPDVAKAALHARHAVAAAGRDEPPSRFAAGVDAVETFKKKASELLADASAHLELSSSLALENA